MLQNDPLRLLPFHLYADPDSALHFDAIRIRIQLSPLMRFRIRFGIQLPKIMQIRIRNTADTIACRRSIQVFTLATGKNIVY
jgi:hypothetical protein